MSQWRPLAAVLPGLRRALGAELRRQLGVAPEGQGGLLLGWSGVVAQSRESPLNRRLRGWRVMLQDS